MKHVTIYKFEISYRVNSSDANSTPFVRVQCGTKYDPFMMERRNTSIGDGLGSNICHLFHLLYYT